MGKWIRAARLFAVGGSWLPAVAGALLAYHETRSLHLFLLILTAAGVSSLHIGANLINDYFDHISGSDEKNKEGIYPFSGGSRVIQEGLIPSRHILLAAIICFTAAAGIGVYLFTASGFWVPVFGLIGLASCVLYVHPRFSLTNLGFGEFAVGLNLGILIIPGSYYVQTSTFSPSSFMLALPISITTMLILLVNEFPDYMGDALAGKRNAVVRLGRKKASHMLVFFLGLVLLLILTDVFLGFIPPWSLISLLSLPLFINGSVLVVKYRDDVPNYIPAIVSVISVNTFVNLYLAVSFLAMEGNWLLFSAAATLVLAYELRTLIRLDIRKTIRDLRTQKRSVSA
jgi:1,4-dihydroxy-2-naphthoate polyprenyltransferase